MKNSQLNTGVLSSCLLLTACATSLPANVIPRENNLYETTAMGNSRFVAQQNALKNAEKTCHFKKLVVIEDNTTYNGVVDEQTGKILEQVSSVANVIFDTKLPKVARDDDYTAFMRFRCD